LNTKIKVLDPHCVNQIAAGEVVERPLSVVKELIENALDASAKKIEVTVEAGGTPLIRIKDDGIGITRDDLQLSILPHATSKISSIEDLDNLVTLGFRGEALPSIASVSRLSIVSRTPQEISGYEIQVEGGNLISTSQTGCPPGTVVTVKDLFFNTPARYKFLRSNTTEFGYISDMVSRLALARPDVSFTLRHPNNLILNTPGKGDLLETIAAIYGNDIARKLIPLSAIDENLQMSGYLSPPELVRSSNTAITFLLNGRVIRSPLLNQALKEGYHTLLPTGTYPIAVLSLKMSPSTYDVNVHPAKIEAKFRSEEVVRDTLSRVVSDTLRIAKPVRNLFTPPKDKTPTITIKGHSDKTFNNEKIATANESNWEQQKILYRRSPHSWEQTKKSNEVPQEREALSNDIVFSENQKDRFEVAETGAYTQNTPKTDKKNELSFQELRPIGQLFTTYLLCTDEKSLYIIDQHAAHERIRYEELLVSFKQNKLTSQLLLIPQTVELTIQEEQILLQNLPHLQEMGFIIEHFGERTYFLRGIPVLDHLNNPGKIFRMFLDQMIHQPIHPKQERLFEEWIFMIACRTAIKGHDTLTIPEMETLIQRLGNTNNPLSCPHGRPTVIEVSKKELENRFKR